VKRKDRLSLKSGAEYDAFTGWRKLLTWKPGELKWWKSKYNRRARKAAKQQLRNAE
jgi:hypothetical protein